MWLKELGSFLLVILALAVCGVASGRVPGKSTLTNHASIDVGNIISVMVPSNPDEFLNVDQLTDEFKKELERIKKQNRASKFEHGLVTLKKVLPDLSPEEQKRTLPWLRKVLRPTADTAMKQNDVHERTLGDRPSVQSSMGIQDRRRDSVFDFSADEPMPRHQKISLRERDDAELDSPETDHIEIDEDLLKQDTLEKDKGTLTPPKKMVQARNRMNGKVSWRRKTASSAAAKRAKLRPSKLSDSTLDISRPPTVGEPNSKMFESGEQIRMNITNPGMQPMYVEYKCGKNTLRAYDGTTEHILRLLGKDENAGRRAGCGAQNARETRRIYPRNQQEQERQQQSSVQYVGSETEDKPDNLDVRLFRVLNVPLYPNEESGYKRLDTSDSLDDNRRHFVDKADGHSIVSDRQRIVVNENGESSKLMSPRMRSDREMFQRFTENRSRRAARVSLLRFNSTVAKSKTKKKVEHEKERKPFHKKIRSTGEIYPREKRTLFDSGYEEGMDGEKQRDPMSWLMNIEWSSVGNVDQDSFINRKELSVPSSTSKISRETVDDPLKQKTTHSSFPLSLSSPSCFPSIKDRDLIDYEFLSRDKKSKVFKFDNIDKNNCDSAGKSERHDAETDDEGNANELDIEDERFEDGSAPYNDSAEVERSLYDWQDVIVRKNLKEHPRKERRLWKTIPHILDKIALESKKQAPVFISVLSSMKFPKYKESYVQRKSLKDREKKRSETVLSDNTFSQDLGYARSIDEDNRRDGQQSEGGLLLEQNLRGNSSRSETSKNVPLWTNGPIAHLERTRLSIQLNISRDDEFPEKVSLPLANFSSENPMVNVRGSTSIIFQIKDNGA